MADKETKDTLIRDAQYRKGLSIAYFNAVNAAIEMCKATSNVTIENFYKWRDLLIEEHNDYYGKVIAQVGSPIDAKATIARLQKTTDKPTLTAVWMSLSEDERQHPEIKTVAYGLREKYLNPVVATPKVAKPKKKSE